MREYVEKFLLNFCNINKAISDIYALVADGLHDFDTIVNIIGRKIIDFKHKSKVNS